MPGPTPYPLVLDAVIVPKPWGGRRLSAYGKTLPDDGMYGESWDVADLPADKVTSSERSRSHISGGDLDGRTIREALDLWGTDLLGTAAATPEGDFPLLYKFLDARENLSVQVHPDEHYANAHPEVRLKTESWYIVEAEPGSVIYKDVRPGVTVNDVAAAANSTALAALLQPVPAEPGAFHHLPAGLIHAVGAGVLVAEPQTPSDTTFRLYDWTEEYGRNPRRLHIEQALDAIRISPRGAITHEPATTSGVRTLISTPHYWMAEHTHISDTRPVAEDGELRVLNLIDGEAALTHEGSTTELHPGDTVIVPAAIGSDVTLATTMSTLLEIGLVETSPDS